MSDRPVVLFNNCRKFDHATRYGRGAFFDLSTDGVQGKQANDLERGHVCVVAAPDDGNRIAFDWYSFETEKVNQKNGYRVFYGKLIKSDILPRGRAVRHSLYSVLFNVNGAFKQWSTLRPQ